MSNLCITCGQKPWLNELYKECPGCLNKYHAVKQSPENQWIDNANELRGLVFKLRDLLEDYTTIEYNIEDAIFDLTHLLKKYEGIK